MSYQSITWVNRDNVNNVTGTKLNADNMNRIEQGIVALDTAVSDLTTQVNAIDPATGTGLTAEQVTLLNTVSDSLQTVQNGLNLLKTQFESHVHSNEVGETTGPVIIQTTP